MPFATQDLLAQNLLWADQFPNIQAAVNAAAPGGANSGPSCVLIPPDYPGTDSYSNPLGLAVLDFRPRRLKLDGGHGAFPINAPRVPQYQGLGLTWAEPGPLLSASPRLTTPLAWLTSTAVLT